MNRQILSAKMNEETRRDLSKQAVLLATQSQWEDAVQVNRTILQDYPDDLNAQNRLGNALKELGRNREAREAFQRALEISPRNNIALKNLNRLSSLGDDESLMPAGRAKSAPGVFIEESGKSVTTSLVNLAPPQVLLKLAPGHLVSLQMDNSRLKVVDSSGDYIGSIEPKLTVRLRKLISGGNQYEATVTSSGTQELTIIIRETYKHPSQAGMVSFPSRTDADHRAYMSSGILDYEFEEVGSSTDRLNWGKDWSDDDTEPGDDEAFSPVIHRIINASNNDDDMQDDEY